MFLFPFSFTPCEGNKQKIKKKFSVRPVQGASALRFKQADKMQQNYLHDGVSVLTG